MTDFYIKQNDTSPKIRYALLPTVDVAGASIKFHMKNSADVTKVDAAGTIIQANPAIVAYTWLAADTDTVGTFEAEFEVTFADGSVETYPNFGNLEIVIADDIA